MTTNAMPQKHDSQRSRQRMYEIQLYEEEMRIQEATACTMSEVRAILWLPVTILTAP